MQIANTKTVIYSTNSTKIDRFIDFRHPHFVQGCSAIERKRNIGVHWKERGYKSRPVKTEATKNSMDIVKFRLDNENMLVYT